MAASMTKLILIAILVVIATMPYMGEAAPSCSEVTRSLLPCANYLMNTGPLTAECCGGVTSLNNAARTTPDRQAVCSCLKQAAAGFSGINPTNAETLPKKCGVNIPYKISTSTNCANVH